MFLSSKKILKSLHLWEQAFSCASLRQIALFRIRMQIFVACLRHKYRFVFVLFYVYILSAVCTKRHVNTRERNQIVIIESNRMRWNAHFAFASVRLIVARLSESPTRDEYSFRPKEILGNPWKQAGFVSERNVCCNQTQIRIYTHIYFIYHNVRTALYVYLN